MEIKENLLPEPDNNKQESEDILQDTEVKVNKEDIKLNETEIKLNDSESQEHEDKKPEDVLNETLNKYSNPENVNVSNEIPQVNENINTTVIKVDIKLSDFITGYTLIVIYDRIYPKFLRYLFKFLFKIEIPQVGLDEDEAAILEPIADKIAEQMTVKVNPFLALFLLSNIFYLNKLDEAGAFDSQPKQLKVKPTKGKRGRPRKNQNNVEQSKGE